MTPQRAQILNDTGNSNYSEAITEAMNVLQSAISSAKAAEEGVEIEHEHVPVCDERGPRTKERCRREAGHSGRHTGRSEGWYTTVISVREKEGL